MNPKRLAQALNTISVGFAEAAEALQVDELPPLEPAPSFADESVEFATGDGSRSVGSKAVYGEEGSLAVCPKHHVPYTDGQYGPYCKQATDDPAWGKQKGDRLWCRITPKNAAEYLRIKAAA